MTTMFVDTNHQEPCDRSYFYSMVDLTTPPVFFFPPASFQNKAADSNSPSVTTKRLNFGDVQDNYADTKRPKIGTDNSNSSEKLLLYVREENDAVFNALVVQPPTLGSLAQAVQEKFLTPSTRIGTIHKDVKNSSIHVKVDDDVVTSIPNESTFTISFKHIPENSSANENVPLCDVILSEIRVHSI